MSGALAERLQLMLITDRRLVGPSLLERVEAALRGGVSAVQLREPDVSAREGFALAESLRAMTKKYQALLIINDRLDVAKAVGADAVHLGWRSLPLKAARAVADDLAIGFSAHNLAEAEAAQNEGADYLTLSPVYPTPSKAGLVPVLGLAAFADITRCVQLPVVGLGGIDVTNAREVIRAGACGVAVIRALLQADEPARAAAALRESLKGHGLPSP